jgi:hypothetical protein
MLQSCLEEILSSKGGNNCKTRHMGKEMLLVLGTLLVRINAMAHAYVISREIIGELDGEFGDDAKGAVSKGAGGK